MFLYKSLLTKVRSRGFITLTAASSGAGANNILGGRTTYSRFKISINLENNSLCNIKKQGGTVNLLRAAKLIIWDEASMAKRRAVEALDRSMQDITGMRLPFGGKIMVLGDPWFFDFLLRVGNGYEQVVDKNYLRIPDDMTIPYNDMARSKEELISAIFPSLHVNGNSSYYIISRAILITKNEHVDELTEKLIYRFCGDEKIYYGFNEAQDEENNFYPMEFLNSLNVSGLPPLCSLAQNWVPDNTFTESRSLRRIINVLSYLHGYGVCKQSEYAVLGIDKTRFLVKSWRRYAISL
ncbi:ATP-dependent DNA helicase PIF1-like protein [Tanacetum coccineum]|uniref:ATP-dependent DNA helicase n=1 Tax=Tanacetum coccineum TaxID=301880 RepID=A0ABQ5BKS7_9ASTR